MASTHPSWSEINADFKSSNNMISTASEGLSRAGTVFSQLGRDILDRQKLAADIAYRDKALAEQVRQADITDENADLLRVQQATQSELDRAAQLERLKISEQGANDRNAATVGASNARLRWDQDQDRREQEGLQFLVNNFREQQKFANEVATNRAITNSVFGGVTSFDKEANPDVTSFQETFKGTPYEGWNALQLEEAQKTSRDWLQANQPEIAKREDPNYNPLMQGLQDAYTQGMTIPNADKLFMAEAAKTTPEGRRAQQIQEMDFQVASNNLALSNMSLQSKEASIALRNTITPEKLSAVSDNSQEQAAYIVGEAAKAGVEDPLEFFKLSYPVQFDHYTADIALATDYRKTAKEREENYKAMMNSPEGAAALQNVNTFWGGNVGSQSQQRLRTLGINVPDQVVANIWTATEATFGDHFSKGLTMGGIGAAAGAAAGSVGAGVGAIPGAIAGGAGGFIGGVATTDKYDSGLIGFAESGNLAVLPDHAVQALYQNHTFYHQQVPPILKQEMERRGLLQ